MTEKSKTNARIGLEINWQQTSETATPIPQNSSSDRLNIGVFGNFAGSKRLQQPTRPIRVNIDNIDTVLEQCQPQLTFANETITFTQLEDFHPDSLIARVPSLGKIYQYITEIRRDGRQAPCFAEAAGLLNEIVLAPEETPGPEAPEPADQSSPFETLLGAKTTASHTPSERKPDSTVNQLLRDIIGDSIQFPDAQAETVVNGLTALLSEKLCTFLHIPEFQQLESLWHGLHFLISELDVEDPVSVYLLNSSREVLTEAVANSSQFHQTELWQNVIESSGISWSFFIATWNYASDDLESIRHLGKWAEAAQSFIVAGARPQLVGLENLRGAFFQDQLTFPQDETWQSLPTTSESNHIGLALGRFLLRAPYGKGSDPIQSFAFEEAQPSMEHENYLWAHPGFACAKAWSEHFIEHESRDVPIMARVDDLPYSADAQGQVPVVECWMSETVMALIEQNRIIPLVSVKNSTSLLVGGNKSLSGKPLSF